jgi:hypothetical protein
VELLKALTRFFGYLFHGLLALFLIAVSGLALASGSPSLRLDMLPWKGSTLIYVLFFGSVFGLLTVILAIRGTWRALFFLWSLAAAALLWKGYVFSGYHFGPGEVPTALYLMVGSLIALAGAWFQLRRKSIR